LQQKRINGYRIAYENIPSQQDGFMGTFFFDKIFGKSRALITMLV